MPSPYVGHLPRHQEQELLLQLLLVTIWSFVLSASFLDCHGHCPAALLKLQSKPTYCTPSTWQVSEKGFSGAI